MIPPVAASEAGGAHAGNRARGRVRVVALRVGASAAPDPSRLEARIRRG
jgi:hypothetical protein